MTDRDPLYRRHRFPAEVIAHAVWLYFRFPLSLRMVEDLLAARGIIVSHQTVRRWAEKFGRTFANEIRRSSSGRLGDKWHLDEAVVSIRGKKHWLWRAVDQDGFVLEEGLPFAPRSPPGRVRLHRNVLQPETQARQERNAVAGRVRAPAENVTPGCLRNAELFRHPLQPSSRTAFGSDEPVGANCPSMTDELRRRLGLP